MSNTMRVLFVVAAAVVIPACYNRSNHTYNTPVGPAGSPGAFTLTSPTHNATATGTTPTFQWTGANGATTYTLQVATDPGITTLVVDQAGIAATMYTLPSAISNGTYYWQVIAHNTTGDTFSTGGIATYSTFTTN